MELSEQSIPLNISGVMNEITSIKTELARLAKVCKELRLRKKELEVILYEYMSNHNIIKIGDVKITTIKPKEKRKTQKEKREEAITFFRNEGITNPEHFWDEFSKTQKAKSKP